MSSLYIFNQYYIDFIKRLKDVAKKNKETSSTARIVLKAIKSHYVTLDKSSDEYLKFLNEQISDEVWNKYCDSTDNTWLEENKELQLYADITIDNIVELIEDDYLCNHFISVFCVFRKDLTTEVAAKIVKILQSIDGKSLIDEIEDEEIKKILQKLQTMRNEKIKDKAGIDMNFIEDTTLGKLAKEILEDIDIGKLQKSMGDNGDVLKAIGDPDSGFADIITNVSKKMASKISNGELKQENLIQDAMKFASIMPNIFGGGGGNAGAKSKGPDLSNIMSMMSSMMGSGGDDDFSSILKGMKDMPGMPKAPKGSKRGIDENALKKIAKAKKLKKKLHEKKKAALAAQAEAESNAKTTAVQQTTIDSRESE